MRGHLRSTLVCLAAAVAVAGGMRVAPDLAAAMPLDPALLVDEQTGAVAGAVAEPPRRSLPRERPRSAGPLHPLPGEPDYGGVEARFGTARGRPHEGQDIFAPAGTPIFAVRDGIVVETGNDGGRGNYAALFSREREETYVYLHMLEPAAVEPGERLRAGQRIGQVGCTGSCWGDHLHFEIREGRGPEGASRDPLPRLQRWEPPPRR